jgi:hypothetical protein
LDRNHRALSIGIRAHFQSESVVAYSDANRPLIPIESGH